MAAPEASVDRAWARRLLRLDPLLSRLPDREIEGLASASRVRVLEAGELLARAGAPQTAVLCLASGKLALYRAHRPRGVSLLLGIVSAPAIVGDAEAAAKTPWMCSVRAEDPATCLLIENQAFFAAVRSDRELAFQLYLDASVRHLLANHTAQASALYDVETRLLRALLDFARSYGRVEADRAFVGRKISQKELAATLGVTSKTISRTLRPLLLEGTLSEDGDGAFVIHGLDRLVAELPPDFLGLTSSLGERVRPVLSRWQEHLDE